MSVGAVVEGVAVLGVGEQAVAGGTVELRGSRCGGPGSRLWSGRPWSGGSGGGRSGRSRSRGLAFGNVLGEVAHLSVRVEDQAGGTGVRVGLAVLALVEVAAVGGIGNSEDR